MNTKITSITNESLKEAKGIIESGGLVAFPTETVYGLGANAFDDDAVKSIFEVKGRPQDNPLIAHVHTDYDLSALIDYDPPYAEKLRKAFLPGPLTLVYRSQGRVSRFVSCGLDTLAIRVPSHEGAQAFLREVNLPVVAPSANISKHISPVTAEHVLEDFNGKIPLILEGGKCTGGIESTVCDVTGSIPVILRAGLITQEMIQEVVGACEVYHMKEGEKPKSPGMAYKHYSPKCRTMIFKSDEVEDAIACYKEETQKGNRPCLLCENSVALRYSELNCLDLGKNDREMAANLYDLLHVGEKNADVIIAIEPKNQSGIMVGVMNRLTRACQGSSKK